MKRCPECRRDYYDETLLYCLDDGSALLDGPATADPSEPVTAVLSPHETEPTKVFGGPGSDISTSQIHARKLPPVLVAVILAILLAGFGYGLYKFLKPAETAVVRGTQNIQIERLTGDGRTRASVISPDGKFLVYIKLEGGQQSLWIKQIQTGSNVNVVKPGESDEFWGITFSPDGNFVYYNAGGRTSNDAPTVYRVPTLGGTPTRFLANAFMMQFSHDGKQISFRRADVTARKELVLIANTDGSQEREILSVGGTQFLITPAPWSPDDKFIAIGIGDDTQSSAVPMLISVSDGKQSEIGSKRWAGMDDIAWHPSGDSLLLVASDNYFIPGQVWEVSYPGGEYRKLTNDVNGHYGVSITSDGKSAVTGELFARSSVWVSPDLKPENAKQIMPATGDTWGIAWTPDGRIVYASDQSGVIEIWIMNSDGSEARALTSDKVPKYVPTVSPDGRYVIYTSTDNGGEIVRIDIGGGNPKVLSKESGSDNPNVSPDGKWVIYSGYVDGSSKVLRVPIDGGETQVLTEDVLASEPRYSNDGTRFACFVLDPKALVWNKIAIFAADGGQPIKTLDVPGDTNAGRGPVWSPDDKNIVVVFAPGEKQNLWQIPVDGGAGKQMTNFDVPGIARREYSQDGKQIAIVRAEGFGNALMITNFR